MNPVSEAAQPMSDPNAADTIAPASDAAQASPTSEVTRRRFLVGAALTEFEKLKLRHGPAPS